MVWSYYSVLRILSTQTAKCACSQWSVLKVGVVYTLRVLVEVSTCGCSCELGSEPFEVIDCGPKWARLQAELKGCHATSCGINILMKSCRAKMAE